MASLRQITHGRPRLVAESGTGLEAVRAYAVRYRPGQHMPEHAHDSASISLIIGGGFDDRDPGAGGELRPGRALTVAIKPARAPHETSVGPRGAVSLVLELPTGVVDRIVEREECTSPWLDRCRWWDAESTAGALIGLWVGIATDRLDKAACLRALGPIWCSPGRPTAVSEPMRGAGVLLDGGTTVGEAAGRLGLHPSHLGRRFRSETGSTPGAWARRARLIDTAEQVATTTRPLASIAHRAGFTDQAHMTRRFRRDLGTTPGALRKLGALV